MKKILMTIVIAGVSLTSISAQAADDDIFADLLNDIQTEDTATDNGTNDVVVSTGDETVENTPSTEVEAITVTDGKFSLTFTDPSGYILGNVSSEMDVLNSISMKYTNDVLEDESVSKEDILKQFSIKVISSDGTEKNITESTTVGSNEKIQISLAPDSYLVGTEVEYTLSGFVPSAVYGISGDTLSEEKTGEFNISNVDTVEPAKEVTVSTPVDKETGAATNILLLVILMGITFVANRKLNTL